MMKFAVSLSLLFVLISSVAFAGGPSSATNQYVSCKVNLGKRTLQPGSTGEMLITLKPSAGIHINLTPPISLTLDSSTTVTPMGSPEIPKKKKFLDVTKPIRQPFTVSPALKPGTVTIKGTVTYYYCSDAEGWCSKFKQPIELSIRVVK